MIWSEDRLVGHARKPHRCVWCDGLITVGEPYLRRVGVSYEYDGFGSWAMHGICDAVTGALVHKYDWEWDLIENGVLGRGVLAHISSAEVVEDRHGFGRCVIGVDPDVSFDSFDGVVHYGVEGICPRCGEDQS